MLDTIIEALGPGGLISIGAGVVYEIVRRLTKTEKPAGLLHDAVALLRKVATYGNKALEVVTRLADILDKVAPQKLK